MKRKMMLALIMLCALFAFTACSANEDVATDTSDNEIVSDATADSEDVSTEEDAVLDSEAESETVLSGGGTTSGDFLMYVADVYDVPERGTVVIGEIERGSLTVGATVEFVGVTGEVISDQVSFIEIDHEAQESAGEGDYVGIGLANVSKDQVAVSMAMCSPGTMKACTTFTAEISLDEVEGAEPFTNSLVADYIMNLAEVEGTVQLPEGMSELKPNETAVVTITLSQPLAFEAGERIVIRHNSQTIGSGTILEVLE